MTQQQHLWVDETWVNASERYCMGNSDVYETRHSTIEELFQAEQEEYGRCVGKAYAKYEDGTSKQVGWVFQRQMTYEDTKEPYLQETIVEVYTEKPVVETIVHCKHYEFTETKEAETPYHEEKGHDNASDDASRSA